VIYSEAIRARFSAKAILPVKNGLDSLKWRLLRWNRWKGRKLEKIR